MAERTLRSRSDVAQPPPLRGQALLNAPGATKGTAFSEAERDALGLRGLLPAQVGSQPLQMERVLENLSRKDSDIERYIFLTGLQARNERLFYRVLIDHVDDVLSLVYTPTVGQACREFAHIFRKPRGFYISANDRGRVRSILDNWPERDVRMIVMTDGERILGLGDLGANGMGIPIGKLSLYTAFAGIAPEQCLPIQIDVGTGNQELLRDPLYLGLNQERVKGAPYLALMDEVMEALHDAFPQAIVQFEDFLTPNAYRLLDRYRDRYACFNDDIQGTAAVALAGLLASTRTTGKSLREQTFLFLGAGSAATGIAELLVARLRHEGLAEEQARSRIWFVDVDGLLVRSRDDLLPHNHRFAHDHEPLSFHAALETIAPDVLIGATGHPGVFDEAALRTLARKHERPVVFALSNPTDRSECTAEQAFAWSGGRAVFASGSPFPSLALKDGAEWRPSQANNAYIFPGIGLGALAAEAQRLSDPMFLAAAAALAGEVSPEEISNGSLYPDLPRIREVSVSIARAVAEQAHRDELASAPAERWSPDALRQRMYDPTY
ncbi:MAG: NAD-dependent malic enzyme [Myxococcota bacterium]